MQSQNGIGQKGIDSHSNIAFEFNSNVPPCITGDASVESKTNQELWQRVAKLEQFIPQILKLISDVSQSVLSTDGKQQELENRISHLQTQLTQLPTLVSSGMSTCTTAMEKIQAELKLLGEKLKQVKEQQEETHNQLSTLFKVTLQKAIAEGHIKIVDKED